MPLSTFTRFALITFCAGFQAFAEDGEAVLQKIAGQEARRSAVANVIAEAKAGGVSVAYPTADLLIAKRFCQYGRDDVANDRVSRAKEVAEEVAMLLDRAEREARAGVAVPRIQADREYPEISYTLIGHVVEGMLGLERTQVSGQLLTGEGIQEA